MESKENKNKAEMEEYSHKITQEIESSIQKLDELLSAGGPFESIQQIYQDINEQHQFELQKQAKSNTEVWKLEKIMNTAQEDSEKINEIIQRASHIIRETQKRILEINEGTNKMREEQKLWRSEKEVEFEKSTQDLSSKINQTAVNDEQGDENQKLMEHYEKLKEQIASSEAMYQKQIDDKDKAIAEMQGPLQEKIKQQTESLTLGTA